MNSSDGGIVIDERHMTPEVEARLRVAMCRNAADRGALTDRMVERAAYAVWAATGVKPGWW